MAKATDAEIATMVRDHLPIGDREGEITLIEKEGEPPAGYHDPTGTLIYEIPKDARAPADFRWVVHSPGTNRTTVYNGSGEAVDEWQDSALLSDEKWMDWYQHHIDP